MSVVSWDTSKSCPECVANLVISHRNGLTTWECPSSHGVGLQLLEAYEHFQPDELEAIWLASKAAPASKLTSPISGKPMVEVTFVADSDLRDSAAPGAREITIEVDRENHFGWFEFQELRSMPRSPERPGTSNAGLVGLDRLGSHSQRHDHIFESLDLRDESSGVSRLLSGLVRCLT